MSSSAGGATSVNSLIEAAQSSDSRSTSEKITSSIAKHATGTGASSSVPKAPSDGTTCASCNKCATSSETDTLKPCTMCHSVLYCSRECKKAHTKQHKKVCAAAAQEYAKTADLKPAVRAAPKQSSRSGGYQKWQFDT